MQSKHSRHAVHSALIHHQLGSCSTFFCWLEQQFHCALQLFLMLLQVFRSCSASTAKSQWQALHAQRNNTTLHCQRPALQQPQLYSISLVAMTFTRPAAKMYLLGAWPCGHHAHKHASSHCASFCMAHLALPAARHMHE